MISTLWFDRRAAAIRRRPASLFRGRIGASTVIVPRIVQPGGNLPEQDPVLDRAAIVPDAGFAENRIIGWDGLHRRDGRRTMAAKAPGSTLQRVPIVITTFPLQVA
jgi:hypothetical protein